MEKKTDKIIAITIGIIIIGGFLTLGYFSVQEYKIRLNYFGELEQECKNEGGHWFCENCNLITVEIFCVIDDVQYEMMEFEDGIHYVSTEKTIREESSK